MKKIAAIFLLCAVVVSFSACHSKKDMTEEEYSKYVSAEESKRAAESQEAEAKISEGLAEVSDDVGKTIKGKKLVLYRDNSHTKQYRVIMMDKDGNGDYMLNYYFAPNRDAYNALIQSGKEDKNIYKKDAASRMVAFKTEGVVKESFKEYYDGYKSVGGWQIVE